MLYFDFPNWQDKKRILKREIVILYHIFIHIQWRKIFHILLLGNLRAINLEITFDLHIII